MDGLWIAFAVVCICALAFWFVRGAFNNRLQDAYRETQEHYEALSDNRKADQLLDDPEHVKRLRDKYND